MLTLQSYTLRNQNNLAVNIINFGAIIQSVVLADGTNIVLGFADPSDYINKKHSHLGTVVGRVANRIANAQFKLGDQCYALERHKNGPYCLHSGSTGLDRVFWHMQPHPNNQSVELSYHSPDGEGGFPGNVELKIIYQLTPNNELKITYAATADQNTPIDLTNHTYWNLCGKGTIGHNIAKFYASHYLPTDDLVTPTGEIAKVHATALDFLTGKPISKDFDSKQLEKTHGYDHYFICDDSSKNLKLAAEIFDPQSQVTLKVFTTEHGFQFYTGNFLPEPYTGFCIETQNYPNAINQANFPSPLISSKKKYFQETIYQIITE